MFLVISHLATLGNIHSWPKRLLTLGTVILLAFQAGPLPLRESWRPPQPVTLSTAPGRAVSVLTTSLPKGPLITSSSIQLERSAGQPCEGKLGVVSLPGNLPPSGGSLVAVSGQHRPHAAGLPITLWDRGPPPIPTA